MASSMGVTTRLQAKRGKDSSLNQISEDDQERAKAPDNRIVKGCKHTAGRGCSKRKSTTRDDVLDKVEGEVCASAYSRRSFPMEHESDQWARNAKKEPRTEYSSKQRRALTERGNNVIQNQSTVFSRNQEKATERPTKDCSAIDEVNKEHTFGNKEKLELVAEFISLPETMPIKVQDTMLPMAMDIDSISSVSKLEHRMEEAPPILAKETSDEMEEEEEEGLDDDDVFLSVRDIDAEPDSLNTFVYSQDIMNHLKSRESLYVMEPDFLQSSPQVTARMRGVLMNWLLQVQTHEELQDETLHLCKSLIDECLACTVVTMPKLQLVGISCLLIASKFTERFAPAISTLCYLTDETFVSEQVIRYEKGILHLIKFNLVRPVATTFLDRYVQVEQEPPEVESLARYILDLSITSVVVACQLPSLTAASALLVARKLLLELVPSWTNSLTFYTGYTEEDMCDLSNTLAILLIKAPTSRFQGARNKFNTAPRMFVSQLEALEPSVVSFKLFGKALKGVKKAKEC